MTVCGCRIIGQTITMAAAAPLPSYSSSSTPAATSCHRSLALRPLFTKIMTGVVGTILGDLAAQVGRPKRDTFVPAQMLSIASHFILLHRIASHRIALRTLSKNLNGLHA